MTEFRYFSEREGITPPRDIEKLSQDFWAGLVSLIKTLVENGSLAEVFPITCFESPLPIDSNRDSIQKRIQAEVPGFPWEPTEDNKPEEDLIMLDGVEFFGRYVSEVVSMEYHKFGKHNHLLRFDREKGFSNYSDAVSLFFRRSSHPFELNEEGEIIRLGPPVLQDIIKIPLRTGDEGLDRLIATAIDKFHDPDIVERKDALDKLWDAWERLKTLRDSDKKKGITLLLESAIPCDNLRERIDQEGRSLTDIGNNFMIRHTETDKIPINRSVDVDYLFHRLYALIQLLVKGGTEGE